MKNTKHYAQSLIGKTISNVRPVTKIEMEDLMWFESCNPTTIIEFTDGTYAIVAADPEMNGTGFLEIGNYKRIRVQRFNPNNPSLIKFANASKI